jgi:hypothetical protein
MDWYMICQSTPSVYIPWRQMASKSFPYLVSRAATDTIEQINPETLEELVIVSVSTGTTCWYYYANGKLSRSEQHDENKKIGESESYDSLGNWLKTEVHMNDTPIKTKDRKNYAPDK